MTRLWRIRARAAKKGHEARRKAECCVCRKGIWNRMITRSKNGKEEYAHSGCISGQQEGWERAW